MIVLAHVVLAKIFNYFCGNVLLTRTKFSDYYEIAKISQLWGILGAFSLSEGTQANYFVG